MSVNLGSSITYANSWQNDLTFEHSLISMIFERSALKMLEGGGRSLPLAAFVNKKGGEVRLVVELVIFITKVIVCHEIVR
ncbi:hypothetical protein J2T50_001607 [Streptococcus gallinaceus]|uniref:Uncharacterized protein n=1 Tax=Streptococcus gallinaceus TaxID=165758 RepID=A0ABV2JLY1_9STRE|nr:hypothetical protein [Streptococcus gallinaceus]MCP1639897.1 hypothetical protein [Streptococcus gallinaceus]MCP1770731.1 hypothetical protein [Streptococcus gallinaceus]